MNDERWFEQLAAASEAGAQGGPGAPAKLKARIYSTVVSGMAAAGPLCSLGESHAGGRALCVFEAAVAALPVGERIKSMNPCRVCHARVLGERMDHAPIFWPGCPYSEFHNG